MLKYLHENGCPWDERVCEEAAKKGHLDVLKYVTENGLPWNEENTKLALESIRKWLKKKDSPQKCELIALLLSDESA